MQHRSRDCIPFDCDPCTVELILIDSWLNNISTNTTTATGLATCEYISVVEKAHRYTRTQSDTFASEVLPLSVFRFVLKDPTDNPLSTSVFPVIPQISPLILLRQPYRSCSVYFWVSLISSSDSIYPLKTNTVLGSDIVLIAILSPDAATQTHLVFGGSRKHDLPITGRVNISRASACLSPTLLHIHTHAICKNIFRLTHSQTSECHLEDAWGETRRLQFADV